MARFASGSAALAATALLGLLAAPAAAVPVTLSCPGTIAAGDQFVGEVAVDVGTTPLGAYGITLGFDPADAAIGSVAGGNTSEFAADPTTNPGSFTTGSTPIAGLQTMSLTSPTGTVSVARVTFHVAASASPTLVVDVTVRSLFDTGGNPIPGTGTGCTVSVTGSVPTTTTSTTVVNTSTTLINTVTTTTRAPAQQPATTTSTVPVTTTLVTTLPASACPDAQAAVAIQSAIDAKCSCPTATSHGKYVKCAAQEAKRVVKEGGFPKACQKAAKACAAHSTCGKPAFVTCCRTTAKGTTKCSIKSGAAACKAPKGGQACVGQHPSCCDACGGGCGSAADTLSATGR